MRERLGDTDSHMSHPGDARDLRLEPRNDLLPRESSRDYSRDLGRDREAGSRDPSFGRDLAVRDVKREMSNRDLAQRDQMPRDLPRDLSSHSFPSWPTSSGNRRLTPSPVITAPSPVGRSLPTSSAYYSRSGQFDAPLLPPRSSPKSPPQDNKLPSQIG